MRFRSVPSTGRNLRRAPRRALTAQIFTTSHFQPVFPICFCRRYEMRAVTRRDFTYAGALAALAVPFVPALAQPVTTTPSGLKIIDTKIVTGPLPKTGQTCAMNYTGWLYENGKKGAKFDSNLDHGGAPFEF